MITVYSKPSCVQCTATIRKLDNLKLTYEVKDAEQSLDYVKGLGYSQAPVVVIADDHPTMGGESWSGYDPDKLSAL